MKSPESNFSGATDNEAAIVSQKQLSGLCHQCNKIGN